MGNMDNATVISRAQAALGDRIVGTREYRGDLSFQIAPPALVEVVEFFRNDTELSYNFLDNLTAVDYLGRDPRFEMVYHLLSHKNRHRICLKVGLPDYEPRVSTLTHIWATANYQERETFDMFGIVFEGHPNLQRILMPDDWSGYPLRKDVPLGYEEVAFTINEQQIYERKPFAEE